MLDVYRTYYKMTGEPFRLSPDHRFSLDHSSYANAKAYLQYAIFQGEGFIAVTGGPGTGKTTLISDLIEGLDKEHIEVATLTTTQLESRDLLQMVVNLFDLNPEDKTKPGLLMEMEHFLNQQSYKGRRVILIVDEAQGLTSGALEELRLLANLQRNHQLLLQVFLVGQEQLLEMLRAPGMEHLHQRLIAASHLLPLGLDEVIDYIEHRLTLVGWKGDPAIDEGALRLIHQFSGGIPRRINLICNRLFLYGGLEQKHELDAKDARLVVAELHKEFLLSQEAVDENEHNEVAEATGADAPVRSLPRRKMQPAQGEASGEPSSTGSSKEQAEKKSSKARRRSADNKPSPDNTRRRDSGSPGDRRKNPGHTASDRVAGRKQRIEPTMRREPTIGARPAPAPAPAPSRKSGSWGKVAAFAVLAGLVYVYFNGTGEFDLQSVINGEEEAKPHAAFNTPVEIGVPVQTPAQQQESGISESTPGTLDADPVQTATAAEDSASTESTEDTDTGAETSGPGEGLPPVESSADAPSPVPHKTSDADSVQQAKDTSSESTLPESTSPVAGEGEENDVVVAEAPREQKPDDSIKVASAQPTKPVETVKRKPVEKVDTVAVEAEKARLQREAELRLAMNLNQSGSGQKAVVPAPVKVAPVPKKQLTPPISSKPKVRVPVRVATAPKINTTPKRSPMDQLKAALLEGQWDSRGKPASLLPSKVTYCNSQGESIACLSIPQDINTKYGAALYKVETTLKGFSEGRNFQLSYRTLVKLLSDDTESAREAALSSESDWQISEYSMSCQLTQPDQVLCRDNKGVTRDYRRSKPAVIN